MGRQTKQSGFRVFLEFNNSLVLFVFFLNSQSVLRNPHSEGAHLRNYLNEVHTTERSPTAQRAIITESVFLGKIYCSIHTVIGVYLNTYCFKVLKKSLISSGIKRTISEYSLRRIKNGKCCMYKSIRSPCLITSLYQV